MRFRSDPDKKCEGRTIPKRETRVLQQNIIENLDGDGTLIANGVF